MMGASFKQKHKNCFVCYFLLLFFLGTWKCKVFLAGTDNVYSVGSVPSQRFNIRSSYSSNATCFSTLFQIV